MSLTCALWDYGVGNLHSLAKALQSAGGDVEITTEPEALEAADVAVLPGVGAFGHVMESLETVRDVLLRRHADGRPILGVCIGMQAFYASSEEAPGTPGLGLLPGTVVRLPEDAGKVPHMGWNTVDHAVAGSIAAVARHQHVYYVHSYAAPAEAGAGVTATTTYGMRYAAAVEAGNTIGFQFHPEKSSHIGAALLAETLKRLRGGP